MANSREIVNKCGIFFGFSAAIGGGILAGIESAIMWPENKLACGIMFGSASCFINSLSYYFVITFGSKEKVENRQNLKHSTTSNLFLVAGFFLGGVMAVSNFNGMYVSYTVLGDKLNQIGDKNVNIPERYLVMLGIFFGIASASSGILFNLTVGRKIWQVIRKNTTPTDDASQQLVLNH